MSAILGLIHFDGRPIAIEALQPALKVLDHRGPDKQGRWLDRSVFLAHWMQHTTPESFHEHQPMVDPAGDLVLVADARIDNRDELLAALGLRSTPEQPITDAELILAAYRRWGADCPDRLIGDFAFAIWDGRYRRLFAARDGMGVRPFYYLHDGRRFAFATLLPAVRLLPEVPQDIDEEMILHFLAETIASEKERTFYQAIRRLPGGHALQVDERGLRCWQYWQPDLEQELHFRTEEEYIEAFRACFEEAVRCRLRSAFPIGSQLSGGLDSSSVTSMAAFLLKDQPLHSFSAIFPDVPEKERKWIDERAYVEAVHRQYPHIQRHFIEANRVSPLINLEDIIKYYGQPFTSANYHLGYSFARMAREHGIRVMLNGIDGDSTISHGWIRLALLFEQQQWKVFKQEIDAFATRQDVNTSALARRFAGSVLEKWARRLLWHKLAYGIYWLQRTYELPVWELVKTYAIRPLVPRSIHRWRSYRQGRGYNKPPLSPLLASWKEQQTNKQSAYTSHMETHWRPLTSGMWQMALEFGDVLERGVGITPRYPFFDRRLIELSVRMPLKWKFRNGWSRYIMRVGLEGVLPKEVQWRASKSQIGYGFRKGLVDYEADRLQRLTRSAEQLKPYVEPEAVYWHYQQLLQDPENTRDNSDYVLYLLCILQAWYSSQKDNGRMVNGF